MTGSPQSSIRWSSCAKHNQPLSVTCLGPAACYIVGSKDSPSIPSYCLKLLLSSAKTASHEATYAHVHLPLVCQLVLTLSGCGCRITKDDDSAQAGSYSAWVPPYSYASMLRLLQEHGLMQPNGTCNPAADLYDIIVCPPFTTKAPQSMMPEHCREQDITSCPQVSYTSGSRHTCLLSSAAKLNPFKTRGRVKLWLAYIWTLLLPVALITCGCNSMQQTCCCVMS